MVLLTGQGFNHQPERFADFREVIDQKGIFLLAKFILLLQLVDINHHWRHKTAKFWVIGQECLILFGKLNKPYFLQHYINNLTFETRIWQFVIKQRVISLFPTFYCQASKSYITKYRTILFIQVIFGFCSITLES